jgi:multidrug efflux pump subunit AcrB
MFSVLRTAVLSPAMRIWLNAWKMAALGVTAHDVRDTLQSNNVIGALGRQRECNLSASR